MRTMNKKFFITLGLFLLCLSAQARETRFVQVAEALYSSSDKKLVEMCVQDINTLKNVDFVVFSGDNIARADKGDLKEFFDIVRGLNYPVYFVLGDRDVSKSKGLNKETYREEALFNFGIRQSLSPNYVFKKNGIIFIVVDGAKEFVTAQNGYYKQDTLDWLDKKLLKYKKSKVVIIQHFPVIDGKVHERNTYKADLYKDVISKHDNILAIVCGHFNENREENVDNVMHFITPSYKSTKYYKIFDIPEEKDFVFTQLRRVE